MILLNNAYAPSKLGNLTIFANLLFRAQRALYESFLQSDQVKSVLRGSAQMLGAITTLRKICNHPDLVCPPDKESFNAFVSNGYLIERQTSDFSEVDEDDSVSEEESLVQRSGKLEVLAKILPLWREQGHRYGIGCIVTRKGCALLIPWTDSSYVSH